MAPYALASEKHWALYPGRSKVIAGSVSNSLVSHCHKYWTVPYPTWKPSIECCRISFFLSNIFFLSHENTKCYRTYIFSIAWKYKKYRIKCFVLSNIFFLSHETIENIESNVFFYRTYIFFIAWIYWKYRIKFFLSNIIFIEFCYRSAAIRDIKYPRHFLPLKYIPISTTDL